MGNGDKLGRIRARAEKQLVNSAHWWLWEQETKRNQLRAMAASKIEGLTLQATTHLKLWRQKKW